MVGSRTVDLKYSYGFIDVLPGTPVSIYLVRRTVNSHAVVGMRVVNKSTDFVTVWPQSRPSHGLRVDEILVPERKR